MGTVCFTSNLDPEQLKSEERYPIDATDDSTADKDIDKKMELEAKIDRTSKKFLFLGTGSSGKSTIFNQLTNIYKTDENNYKIEGQPILTGQSRINVIRENCLKTMMILITKAAVLYNRNNIKHKECYINEKDEKLLNALKFLKDFPNELFDNEIENNSVDNPNLLINQLGKHIKYIWSIDGIKNTWKKKQLFSIIENQDYFFDKIDIVMSKDYEPSLDDTLRARIRTTGILEKTIYCRNIPFVIVDVGGQRNERRKWIQQFVDITALIYVSALNHYCRVLFEDENKNAMLESIETFEQIINYKLFLKKHVIMFLNKEDLFDQSIKDGKTLKICFGKKWTDYPNRVDYTPSDNKDEDEKLFEKAKDSAIEFIQNEYASVSKWERKIYFHKTTATDKKSIETVFWDVQNMVIEKNLHRGGLV